MEIGDSPEEAAFRAEAYDWLASNAELRTDNRTGPRSTHGDQASLLAELERARAWQRTLYDGGWAGITLPEEYGGRGGTGLQQVIFNEEMAKFDVSLGGLTVALAMVVPTLIAHGTDEQKDRHIDRILRGEELWCQLYSEPGAGSDLASLGTRAVLDGDEYVVNGQKVWNSFAQLADYGILLARTDPDQPKNRGITYFIVDMATEGIEARPLRQITGIAHFNEVFLADARVPATNVVGEVGEGWRVAQTTLANERAMIGGGGAGNLIADIIELARRYRRDQDPQVRQCLVQACRSRAHHRLSRLPPAYGDEPRCRAGTGSVDPQAGLLPTRGLDRRPRAPDPRPGSDAVGRRCSGRLAVAGLLPQPVRNSARWRYRRDPEERDRRTRARPAARTDVGSRRALEQPRAVLSRSACVDRRPGPGTPTGQDVRHAIERCTVTTPARDRTSRETKKSQQPRKSTVQKAAATKRTRQVRKVAKKPAGGIEIRLAVTEAAERLFRERSPADVTLREIAAEAGVNYSLVYRYFRTKDALIAAVFSPRVNMIREHYVDAPGGVEALRDLHYMHDAPGYARSLAWVILEGHDLGLLFQDLESEDGSAEPADDADVAVLEPYAVAARVAIGGFLALAMGWDLYEPYLLRLTGLEHIDKRSLNEHLARLADALLASAPPKRKAGSSGLCSTLM